MRSTIFITVMIYCNYRFNPEGAEWWQAAWFLLFLTMDLAELFGGV